MAVSILIATAIMADLPNGIERLMGLTILGLVLWLSFLLDSHDMRNHARAAWLLAERTKYEFTVSLPPEFVRLMERVEKLAKSGITLDDLFPVDGVDPKAKPAVDGIPAEELSTD